MRDNKKEDRHATIRDMARAQFGNTVDIDVDAVVSEGDDNGCYVAAWVWVDFEDTPFDKTPQGVKDCTACDDGSCVWCLEERRVSDV